MDTLIHADIFFFVTTIAVILVAVLLTGILTYLFFIAREIREIFRIIKSETRLIKNDVDDLRSELRKEGIVWQTVSRFLTGIFRKGRKRSK